MICGSDHTVSPLVSQAHSYDSPQRLCFELGYVLQVGPIPLLWNLIQFSSFSVAVDGNVNKLLCLESVM